MEKYIETNVIHCSDVTYKMFLLVGGDIDIQSLKQTLSNGFLGRQYDNKLFLKTYGNISRMINTLYPNYDKNYILDYMNDLIGKIFHNLDFNKLDLSNENTFNTTLLIELRNEMSKHQYL